MKLGVAEVGLKHHYGTAVQQQYGCGSDARQFQRGNHQDGAGTSGAKRAGPHSGAGLYRGRGASAPGGSCRAAAAAAGGPLTG
jgi:hypothetical protein